jgi:hypothetical protein
MKNKCLIFVLALGLFSCKKDDSKFPDTLTVNVNQSGTIYVKVTDNNNVSFKGAVVAVFSSLSNGVMIYSDSTNESGICNLGKVLQGEYYCTVTAKSNNKYFVASKYFQVIAGEKKVIELKPFLNVATVKIKIENSYSVPISNVNVALIPHPNYSNVQYYYNDLLNEAYNIGVTDADGLVIFNNVPSGSMEYSILAYYDSSHYDYPSGNNMFYVYGNQVVNYTIQVDL